MKPKGWVIVGLLLGLALLFVAALLSGAETVQSIFAIAVLLVGVPVGIVCFIDLVTALKARGANCFLTGLASVPVLLLGLVSIVFGLAIICAVLFNQFIAEHPESSRASLFISFGIGPALVAIGWHWVRLASVRTLESPEPLEGELDEGSL